MKNKYRSIFISDIHLGSYPCKANILLSFLKENESDNLFLIGDIIDGWRLQSKFYWPQKHTDVLRKFLNLSHKNVNIVWITGNHDEFLRQFSGLNLKFGNITICDEYDYVTIKNKKLLITHGDKYDQLVKYSKFLNILGDKLYNILVHINIVFNFFRKIFKLKYWSLSHYIKMKSKQAVIFIFEFKKNLILECKRNGYNGVICGHIHCPEIEYVDDILYLNTGDWVENCSAIVEDYDGNFKIILWKKEDDNG
jgi:UDP-2,3-diacylglucosamine pyrophosphatase LpxH